MVAVAFLALVILALVNIAFWWVMRIRLMRMDSARDRIEWLSFRSGDAGTVGLCSGRVLRPLPSCCAR
jgi:hypothetical protein